jgi:hypothetical protein
MPRKAKNPKQKVLEHLGERAEAFMAMTPDELKARLVTISKHEQEVEKELEGHEQIKELKDQLKELQGPFKDTLKDIKIQRQFIVLTLEEKGK